MRTILLCAFRYPPYSRVGAYRWTKLSRRLAERGHTVHVCTVRWPEMEATDWLEDANHPRIRIHRAPSGYFQYLKYVAIKHRLARELRGALVTRVENLLRLDEAQLWGPFLLAAARRIMRDISPEVLIATGPPFSANLTAVRIKEHFPELRLIQDFRDPWEANTPREREGRRRALLSADAVVAVTPEMVDFFSSAGARQPVWISNGFEPKILRAVHPPESPTFDFVHIGGAFNDRAKPLARFLDWVRRTDLTVKVLLIGRSPTQVAEDYADLVARGRLLFQPQMPQREALQRVAEARFALQLNAPQADTQVSTKIFEYGALRVPTVSINYGGAVDKLVRKHGLGWSIDGNAADFDAQLNLCMSAGSSNFAYDVDEYSFDVLATRYSELIESL